MAGTDIENAMQKSGLKNVTLRNKSGKGIAYTIQWMQTARRLFGCKEQYRRCKYVSPSGLPVTVFIAEISGNPPATFETSGYNYVLHAGLVGGDVFFVVHPREWMPFQHRFMTDQNAKDQQKQWVKENPFLGSSSIVKLLSEAFVGEYLHYIG